MVRYPEIRDRARAGTPAEMISIIKHMKPSIPAVLLLFVTSAFAQSFFRPYEQLRQFLQLTDSQLQSILTNNGEYNRFVQEKQARIWQVQVEIREETAREPLDPPALGIRYAEIEALCREMKDRADRLRTKNVDLLNADQKTKLKILEDALKLAPVVAEAQYGNLMSVSVPAPYAFTSSAIGIGVIGGGISGCYMPLIPTTAIRRGDFTP